MLQTQVVGGRACVGTRAMRSAAPAAARSVPLRRRALRSYVVTPYATATTPAFSAKTAGSSGDMYDVVIVGGGLSGLCTAQALNTKHGDVVKRLLVTEERARVGGNITTVSNDEGYLWEEGPNSFQPSMPILRMAADSGVKDELVFGDPDAPRFVWWEGKLRPVPGGLADLPVFDLMSIVGKIRAGLGALGLRPAAPDYEESVEQFVRRNLGAEVFERLIEPFCSGVYAGDPAKLSMKAAFGKVWRLESIGGSVVGGSIKTIQDRKANPPPPWDADLPKPKGQTVGSFRRGLQTLPIAIEKTLGAERVRVDWQLTAVARNASGAFDLTYKTPQSGSKTITARSVIFTIPSYRVAELLGAPLPPAAEKLDKFFYPPVGAVTVAYPESAIREDRLALGGGKLIGFGQLHPRSQGITTLGTIYSSALFPGRAPPGMVLLLNYIGGVKNQGIKDQTAEQLVAQVDKDLRVMLLKPDAPAPKMLGVRVWPQAIPQFNIGHLEALAAARATLKEAQWDGAFLGGNYAAGVALGRCVEGAYESAAEVAGHLKAKV